MYFIDVIYKVLHAFVSVILHYIMCINVIGHVMSFSGLAQQYMHI